MARPTLARVFPAHLRHNAQRVRALAPRANVLACVKANGYGHGIIRVAEALQDIVQGFAVSCIDEGLELRTAGITQRIVLLEGPHSYEEIAEATAQDLTLCINDKHQLDWLEVAKEPRSPDCWLKIDTGMHRMGLGPEWVAEATQRLQALPQMRSKPVLCTHFARADEPKNNGCQEQLERFDRATGSLSLQQSCANSAAILRYPDSHRDWVRPGYMLYGGCPFDDSDPHSEHLLPAMELCSQVISLRDVAAGESVGYGGRWRARRPSRIGTIAIGYGDGYPRHAPDGTPIVVAGLRVPLAGRVSMDMLTVDLTDHPSVTVGSDAILWGADPGVDEIAHCAGTIGYELLAAMPSRVPRILQD